MKVKQLFKVLSVSVLSAILLAACGGETEVSTKEKNNDTTKQEQSSEKPQEKKTESKVGTRSNPVKFTEIASIDTFSFDNDAKKYKTKIELSVVEVTRGADAQQKLKQMNEFNADAPDGYEWVLVKGKVKVVESETEDYPFQIDNIMNFNFVSQSGDVYSGDIVGTTEPAFSFEMYNGNEKEGYIAGLIKAGEDAQMKYNSMVSSEVFFNLK
ncbi:hypothetical protein [Neobacillus niacini]|uniref:hypothetical protein n=1 Tax=Neobacillus niacini TaxID=86668 RepID=UPI0021CB01B4|nr:hypothetical protein [Neobacillus niacini]MCM3763426.1 hypothetical protein [Neobacillus niacini]